MINSRSIITIFFSLFLICCENKFQHFDDTLVHKDEINFSDSGSIPFLYCVPTGYDYNKSYPLIIALHGYGSSAEAFFPLWKQSTDSLGFVLLVPQGDIPADGAIGFSWSRNSGKTIRTTLSIISEKINIDPSRVYLAGFSQGGIHACELAVQNSLVFRGFASICAPLEEIIYRDHFPLNTKIRAYISCGELENETKLLCKNAAEKLNVMGYITKYVEYKNSSHTIPKPVNKEIKNILQFLDNIK